MIATQANMLKMVKHQSINVDMTESMEKINRKVTQMVEALMRYRQRMAETLGIGEKIVKMAKQNA
jgi:thiaminase